MPQNKRSNHKRILTLAALVAFSVPSFALQADTIFGVHAEAQYWQAKNKGHFEQGATQGIGGWESDQATRLTVSLNHFIPLIPNVMVERQWLKTAGANQEAVSGLPSLQSNWDLGHDTLTLYYRLFDNDLVQFHFGVSASRYDGHVLFTLNGVESEQSFKKTIPTGYVRLAAGLPFTGWSVRAQGHPVSFGDHDSYDLETALRYEFMSNVFLDGHLSIGYRTLNLKLDNVAGVSTDFDIKGPFVNLSLHF